MRRLFGCLFMLLLIGAVLLILVARGPGLRTLPIPENLKPLASALTPNPDAGGDQGTQPATPAQPAPTTEPPTANPISATAVPQSGSVALTAAVVGPAGEPIETVIDGNAIGLTATVANSTQTEIAGTVAFSLEPSGAPIASCQIEVEPASQGACTAHVAADGWAWQDHQPVGRRTVYATLAEAGVTATVEVPVQPKPVILVHGFNSNAAAWSDWTGPQGFLAPWGIAGYAVGDDHFDVEPMDTGDPGQPRRPTKSIEENAAIVARYVEAVRQATGAERVDLVGHSMGGLISRYYVSFFMPLVERQDLPAVPAVNQLYMIGTPNAGTACAIPPAALGLFPPATTQLTPSYMQLLFNPQTSDHRGVPFFILAGDPVHDYAALVCTSVPTDVFVSVASAAGAIPVNAETLPVRHGEQTKSPAVFDAVLQSLTRAPRDYPIPLPAAPAVAATETAELQVSLVESGSMPLDGPATINVAVDESEQVNFMLYAPGDNVEMSTLSTTGQVISAETAQTDPQASAAEVEGPGLTATEGLSIRRPRAGHWQLILTPKAGTKAGGAFYTVAAFLQSELRLTVETPSATVSAGDPLPVRAILSGPAALETAAATATVRDAHGDVVSEVVLSDDGLHDDGAAGDGVFGGLWESAGAGLYGISVTASGQTEAGNAFQRLGMLAGEVQ